MTKEKERKMTKKHFKRLAAALAASRPPSPKNNEEARWWQWDQWNRDSEAIAQACYEMNPKFEFRRFYKATDEEVK